MPSHDRTRLARACYQAYETGDRQALEDLIAADFAFWSPQDEGIGPRDLLRALLARKRDAGGVRVQRLDERGNEVVVTYEAERADGPRFRDTEVLTFADERVGGATRVPPKIAPTAAGRGPRWARWPPAYRSW